MSNKNNRYDRYFSVQSLWSKHIEGVLVSRSLAWSRLILAFMLSFVFFLPIVFFWLFSAGLTAALFCRFAKCLCWIIGLKIIIRGDHENVESFKEGKARQVYVSNHVSYLDIVALKACFDVRFISKKEVSSWPYIGWLARLGDTVFINRRGASIKEQFRQVSEALRIEHPSDVIFFPEGTTSGGWNVLAFKTALFDLLVKESKESSPIFLRPVSLWYSKLDNMEMTAFERDFVSWGGLEALYPHIVRCLGMGCITLEVFVHDAIQIEDSDNRKTLSSRSRSRVIEGIDILREHGKK